ncbi:MAG: DUF4492 domain-containing protein [Bacteroides sp.]|nr:DUF4492 domain-containing protein [Lachnospiraceae bacterium]MCM1331677.1 DUF4492 domain-containing protein [Bacteroides sp.]MCM1389886.1 DUF4492 domain-containing protein [Bacteroides sp.]
MKERAKANAIVRIYRFYRDGFREMTVGRWLWLMIIVKLFILFFIFKLFFFPDILSRDYDNDSQRAEAVRSSLMNDRRGTP